MAVPLLGIAPLVLALAGTSPPIRLGDAIPPGESCVSAPAIGSEPERVKLAATQRGLGTEGYMTITMAPSPFGVSLSQAGQYLYEVTVQLAARPPAGRVYVAWAATPELDQTQKLGVIGESLSVTGQVGWMKFLVFVTAEPSDDGDTWRGPVLLTGISPSGNLHTMAGHGIFEAHGIGC